MPILRAIELHSTHPDLMMCGTHLERSELVLGQEPQVARAQVCSSRGSQGPEKEGQQEAKGPRCQPLCGQVAVRQHDLQQLRQQLGWRDALTLLTFCTRPYTLNNKTRGSFCILHLTINTRQQEKELCLLSTVPMKEKRKKTASGLAGCSGSSGSLCLTRNNASATWTQYFGSLTVLVKKETTTGAN